MDSQILLYSIALSFQITGSILFIAYSSSLCRISIIRSFAANSFIIKDGDTKKIDYNHNAFIAEYKKAYFSRMTFIYLLAGYILSIFCDLNEYDKRCVAALVAVFTGILYLCTKLIIEKYCLTRPKVVKLITSEELTNLGISPCLEKISSEEIELFFTNPNTR